MNKELTINELRDVQLQMLEELDSFCRTNNITYYLTGGSLLGAVRHKGYIPWDDDIDVFMPRAHYQRFIQIYNEQAISSELRVVSIQSDPDYYLPYAKLIHTKTVMREVVDSDFDIGVFIDIFPLDNMTDDYTKAKHLFRKIEVLRWVLTAKNISLQKKRVWYKEIILRLAKLFTKFVNRNKLLHYIDKLSRTYESMTTCKYVCAVCMGTYGIKEILEREWYDTSVPMEFEGRMFQAPVGYKQILEHFYRDYMKLPPVEKQCSHHAFSAWKKE